MTPARRRALRAVEQGKVFNRFDRNGNVFECPPGISPRICRDLQTERLIEDAVGTGHYATRFRQQLTDAGRAAIAKAEGGASR